MVANEFDDLWVVVPLYNEAPVLDATLTELSATFGHVCVVDDASKDGSAAIAESFYPKGVRLLRHPFNLGQGAALQTGIDYALRDPLTKRIVTFDADGQHRVPDAAAMARLLDPATSQDRDLDVVLASRFLDGTGRMGAVKRGLLKLAVAYTNFSVGSKLTDTHNGLRAMKRQVAERIQITQNGMAHATEVLEQVVAMKAKYGEYAAEVNYSAYSKSKGQSLLNSVNILVDLLLR